MVLKTQTTAPPLETIYEESGSFSASAHDIQRQQSDETIHGLISSRSITPVHIQRQREHEKLPKPPIEVLFRDGSKRYIHPSTTKHQKKSEDSPKQSKKSTDFYHQQILPSINNKKIQSKPPLVITIISADELKEANISPTRSTSPSESEASTSTHTKSTSTYSKSTSSSSRSKPSKIPIKQSTIPTSTQQPIMNNYTLTFHSPATLFQQPPRQQIAHNNHRNSNQSQLPASSLQGTMKNDENDKKHISSNIVQPSTTTLVGGGSRSAFRPFLKPVRIQQQPLPITPRVPLTVNGKPYKPPRQQQQQQQIVPYIQKNPPKPSYSNQTHRSIPKNTDLPIQNTPPNLNNALVPTNTKKYQQQSISSKNIPHVSNVSTNPDQTVSLALNSQLNWFNVTSNSLYDIPRLSKQYSSIPLHVTLPVPTPTHNRRLVLKHDLGLENRLLNAGLSPETVALYERILDIAENNRLLPIVSPPKIVDHYSPYKSLQ